MFYVDASGIKNLPGTAASAAIVLGTSEAFIWGYAASPIVLNKILSDPQGSLDFVMSMFPGTTPTMNWHGVYGATTGKILGTDK